MKTYLGLFVIVIVSLSVIKFMEYFRYIKNHKKQIEQLGQLIVDLKRKQVVLIRNAKAIQLSEKHHKKQIDILITKIYESINNHLKTRKSC